MNEHVHKTDESKNALAMNESSTTLDSDIGTFQFQDNRSEATRQLKLKKIANDYTVSHLFQAKRIHNESKNTIIQRSETGIANEKNIDDNVNLYLDSEDNLEGIIKSINDSLIKEKVPIVDYEISDEINSGAQFYFQKWKIQFSKVYVESINFKKDDHKD